MTRITEIENASIRREVVAPRISINWNPLDNSGAVVFDTAVEERINGEFHRLIPHDSIAVNLGELASRTVTVPGVGEVPFALVMGYIKQVFDDVYLEQQASQVSE